MEHTMGLVFARCQPPHESLCVRLKPSLILITSDQQQHYRQTPSTNNPVPMFIIMWQLYKSIHHIRQTIQKRLKYEWKPSLIIITSDTRSTIDRTHQPIIHMFIIILYKSIHDLRQTIQKGLKYEQKHQDQMDPDLRTLWEYCEYGTHIFVLFAAHLHR